MDNGPSETEEWLRLAYGKIGLQFSPKPSQMPPNHGTSSQPNQVHAFD